jgi:hypothetical protein
MSHSHSISGNTISLGSDRKTGFHSQSRCNSRIMRHRRIDFQIPNCKCTLTQHFERIPRNSDEDFPTGSCLRRLHQLATGPQSPTSELISHKFTTDHVFSHHGSQTPFVLSTSTNRFDRKSCYDNETSSNSASRYFQYYRVQHKYVAVAGCCELCSDTSSCKYFHNYGTKSITLGESDVQALQSVLRSWDRKEPSVCKQGSTRRSTEGT